jgi:NADH:ubiquinone oxidoreductase subunit
MVRRRRAAGCDICAQFHFVAWPPDSGSLRLRQRAPPARRCEVVWEMSLQNFHDDRLQFIGELEVMDVDFSDLTFETPEKQVAATGRQWFFLVNYRNCHIYPDAWLAFAHRGKLLNKASSLGSVRYDASEKTGAEISEKAAEESFDLNLFASREAALARIAEMREARPKQRFAPEHSAPAPAADYSKRVAFDADRQIMDVDFSDFTFADTATVNAFYDHVDHQLWKTAKRWYFLVNYNNCRIFPEAWAAFAHRGKNANVKHSLGTVRYDASPETAEEIRRKANTDSFDPNLCASREAAIERIAEMRGLGVGA